MNEKGKVPRLVTCCTLNVCGRWKRGSGKCGSGKHGTRVQGWKTRELKPEWQAVWCHVLHCSFFFDHDAFSADWSGVVLCGRRLVQCVVGMQSSTSQSVFTWARLSRCFLMWVQADTISHTNSLKCPRKKLAQHSYYFVVVVVVVIVDMTNPKGL